MALTPETLTRHELTGLHVRVAAANNPDLVGVAGRVVRETMRTLHVCDRPDSRSDASRVRQVPKVGSTLEFRLPDDSVTGPGPGSGRPPMRVAGDRDRGASAGLAQTAPFASTDEAAGVRKAPGTASELPSETAGRSGQSGGCEGAAYVTVDGDRLLARPALRTEKTGDNQWR
jgi:ribonuclease P protein subunit POP4